MKRILTWVFPLLLLGCTNNKNTVILQWQIDSDINQAYQTYISDIPKDAHWKKINDNFDFIYRKLDENTRIQVISA
jgi:hypothetical protein